MVRVELDREADGRWIAEVFNMLRVSGLVAYGETREKAYEGATALALRVAAGRIELKELSPAEILPLSLETA